MVDQTFKGIFKSLSHTCSISGIDALLLLKNYFLDKVQNHKDMY